MLILLQVRIRKPNYEYLIYSIFAVDFQLWSEACCLLSRKHYFLYFTRIFPFKHLYWIKLAQEPFCKLCNVWEEIDADHLRSCPALPDSSLWDHCWCARTFVAFYRLFCVHLFTHCIFSLWCSGLVLTRSLEIKKITIFPLDCGNYNKVIYQCLIPLSLKCHNHSWQVDIFIF